MKTGFIAASIALTLLAWAPPAPSQAVLDALRDRGALAWQTSKLKAIRGVTIGPIENKLHPDRGYGSDRCARTMEEARRMGANWVSLTPFGRVWDLSSSGIALDFEAPSGENRRAVRDAVAQAHAAGLRVLLVPHLWVESGGWRGEIEPGSEERWRAFAASYRRFVLHWAQLAREAGVDMLAVGIELRSWVTTARAPEFADIVREVRSVYPGPLTYAANWDDVEQTVIWGELDIIGINGFYPLARRKGAPLAALRRGAGDVRKKVKALAEQWDKPVLFTEFGYTTREDPAIEPWIWPDHLEKVVIDEQAQADAYRALLGALVDEPRFAGFFVWRVYADPDDVSQEAEWGFSPRGKRAELVLRDAFTAHWAADGPRPLGAALIRRAAERVGDF